MSLRLASAWAVTLLCVTACAPSSIDSADEEGPGGAPQASSSATPSVDPLDLQARWEAIGSCLQDRGLEVTVTADGGFEYQTAVVSNELFDRSFAECESELEGAGVIGPPPAGDPEYLRGVYDEIILPQYECLRDADFPVTEPPSQAAWVESRGAVWDPFEAVLDTNDGEQIQAAQAQCG